MQGDIFEFAFNPGTRNAKRYIVNLHIENPLILVVEDDRDTLELMTSALSTDGLSCVPAVSVAEAIAAVKQNKITLVVLDWGLDRNGGEVLQATRALYPEMPVIVVSGRPYDVRTDAIVGQADAFLHKPFSATVLRNQVAQLLELRRIQVGHRPEAHSPAGPCDHIVAAPLVHPTR